MVWREAGATRPGARGLVVACHGAVSADARARCIEPVARACARAHRGRMGAEAPVRLAFTSARVRAALAGTAGAVEDPASALEGLWGQGVRSVAVASSHLVEGASYSDLAAAVRAMAPLFDEVRLARPLISCAADARAVADAICAHLPRRRDRPVVLVGHGARGTGELAYLALGRALLDAGRDDVLIGVLRGAPGVEEVRAELASRAPGAQEVLLAPLMLSDAGHAARDVASAGPASWRTRLSAAGVTVSVSCEGLGSWPEVQRLAAAHLMDAPAVEARASRTLCAPTGAAARFPLFVELAGARCLVVGCGAVGARRARALARFGAHVVAIDPDAPSDMGEGVEVLARSYEPGDEEGCALAVAATDDRATNRAVAERCRRRGIPVSVADAPGECTFFFPALCEGELLVAGVASRAGDADGHALVARAAADIRRTIP